MCKFSIKSIRKNHFIIYDNQNQIICYLEDFNELSRYINYTLRDLVKRYNKVSINDTINICIDNRLYQLYTFED